MCIYGCECVFVFVDVDVSVCLLMCVCVCADVCMCMCVCMYELCETLPDCHTSEPFEICLFRSINMV